MGTMIINFSSVKTKGKGIQRSVDLTEKLHCWNMLLKVVEQIFEHRIPQQIDIDDTQFGFMKDKGTTYTIFIVRQIQEKFRTKGKKLYFCFVGSEKAFDRVQREVIRWAICELELEEWLVSAVMSLYTGAKTGVRTVHVNSNGFEVKVGMHQGSALSPLLFVIVMEALSREFRVALPWELLYAADLVVVAESEDDLIKRLNEWKDNVENRGMRVNMNKTKVMISGNWQKEMQKAVTWPCGICVEALVIIQFSVLVVRSEYTENVVA